MVIICQLPVSYREDFVPSHINSEYKEIPENSMFSGKIVLFALSIELSLAELQSL